MNTQHLQAAGRRLVGGIIVNNTFNFLFTEAFPNSERRVTTILVSLDRDRRVRAPRRRAIEEGECLF